LGIFKLLAGVVLATFVSVNASNAAVFDFNFSPLLGIISANGTLTTDSSSPFENIIGISGQVNGVSIAGLDSAGINLLDPTFLAATFSFSDTGGVDYTISTFFFPPFALALSTGSGAIGVLDISPASLSAVPLPASLPMFGGALLALTGFSYGMNRWVAAKGKQTVAASA
jgi:hypothetical protein